MDLIINTAHSNSTQNYLMFSKFNLDVLDISLYRLSQLFVKILISLFEPHQEFFQGQLELSQLEKRFLKLLLSFVGLVTQVIPAHVDFLELRSN